MFCDNLKRLRNSKNLTQEQLAKKLQIAKSTISMYENGNRIPDLETLEIIADFFNVSLDSLTSDRHLGKGIKIPVLGYIRAGVPFEAVEDIIDYEEISPALAGTGEFFCLQIKGQSMEPKISEGDVIVVRKQDTVDNGDVAVVLVNGSDATVKKFYKTDKGVKLVANNPAFEPLFYTCDEVSSLPVTVIGKAIELRAKL